MLRSRPLLFNILGYFFLNFPHFGIFDTYFSRWGNRYAQIIRDMYPFSYRILPTIIGFAYLCDLDILFSLWFFKVVSWTLEYSMNATGFSVGLSGQAATSREIGNPQSHGALMFLVVWSVSISRKHL